MGSQARSGAAGMGMGMGMAPDAKNQADIDRKGENGVFSVTAPWDMRGKSGGWCCRCDNG
ncbi:hypothetical protein GGTG_01088 [Gaeumannomyces tritici R3-111a-1]|uniref:Uncharacterized protein n=1 Tax=Gaeumannomyces tritici (strain R3-111a-1) TaxID=644352 RepID=J3NIK9_GAET3|nr:hypothetical protein GGTG_01088 [Gaeumannomyces tritici R3-111a-1]EJT81102.1 hypothetical protein GGTG_01088 [Gaeumannomyces tritici R3-111a-1]